MRESPTRQSVEGKSHAPTNGAQALRLIRRKKSALKIRAQILAHELALAPERKSDHHQHDKECGNHDEDIGQNKCAAAKKNSGTVPDAVHTHCRYQTERWSNPLECEVAGLARESEADSGQASKHW